MRIANNLMAINTHRQLGVNQLGASKSMEKLSSGYRVNRAADDAAGLSISEKMRGQIRGLYQAQRNAQDGISLIQTAEGALDEISNMLVRMKELLVQRANDTYSSDDRDNINLELVELIEEIDNIVDTTDFNGMSILTTSADLNIIVSDDGTTGISISAAVLTDVVTLAAFTIGNITTITITDIEDAIKAVNSQRATYGALQNRMESTVRNIGTTAENLQAAESRIRDTDMALEMMKFTKNNILNQAATAMLAQANMMPQTVLQLLG